MPESQSHRKDIAAVLASWSGNNAENKNLKSSLKQRVIESRLLGLIYEKYSQTDTSPTARHIKSLQREKNLPRVQKTALRVK